MMSAEITAKITPFHPEYDAGKLSVLVDEAKAIVAAFIGVDAYPSGDDMKPDLDAVTAKLVRAHIHAEQRGYLQSRSIEGFSETFSQVGVEDLGEQERAVLRKYFFGGI